MANTMEIDTGDTVFHRPTGETWEVACVEDDRLSWCGWPEGSAHLSDCELIEKATPDARMALLHGWAKVGNTHDHRTQYARARLDERSK